MSTPRETRSLVLAAAEVRMVEADGGKRTLTGYAAVYNTPSADLGGFVETLAPGAFDRCLGAGPDVRFLVNHDPNLILGRTRSGTLRLESDARGLRFELDLPATDVAAHYASAVERGDLDGCSFRFYVVREQWDTSLDPARRTLLDVDIDDVCLAVYPAYPDTSAAVRSLEEHRRQSAPPTTPRRNRAARRLRLAESN